MESNAPHIRSSRLIPYIEVPITRPHSLQQPQRESRRSKRINYTEKIEGDDEEAEETIDEER
jgi:hypothetical protein